MEKLRLVMLRAHGGGVPAIRGAPCPPDDIGQALHDTNALLPPFFCAFSCFLRAGSGGVMPSSSREGIGRAAAHRHGCRGDGVRLCSPGRAQSGLALALAGVNPRHALLLSGKPRGMRLYLLQADPDWRMGEGVLLPMALWVCVFCVVLRNDGRAYGRVDLLAAAGAINAGGWVMASGGWKVAAGTRLPVTKRWSLEGGRGEDACAEVSDPTVDNIGS